MEFHPVLSNSANGKGVVGSADAANVTCPDSVLHGHHRKQYDVSPLPHFDTPYTQLVTTLTHTLTHTPTQCRALHISSISTSL